MGKRSRRRTPGEAAAEASDAPEAGAAPDGSEAPAPPAPRAPANDGPPRSDPTGRAAWILLETYRWVVQRAEAPGPEVWDDEPEFPGSREVEELFGSWEQLWEAAGLYDAPYFKALDEADAEHEDLASRRDATEREAARLRTEAERREAQMRELRRQADRAREKADRERAELQAESARADAAERRATEAERRIAEGREGAPDPGPPPEVPPDWLAEHEALLAARDQAERHSEALAQQLDHALEELEERDRALAELRRGLAGADSDAADEDSADAPADAPAPATVLEAVERAAERAPHLRFAPRAFESAAESPFSRPQLILDNLMRLDELAAAYLQGDLGERLADVAFRMRLAWRGGISERTRTRYGRDYDFAYDGRTLQLGPHIRIGSGAGAGAIARIYLHLHPGDDDLERSVIVGHVGRHLPDSTT